MRLRFQCHVHLPLSAPSPLLHVAAGSSRASDKEPGLFGRRFTAAELRALSLSERGERLLGHARPEPSSRL